MLKKRWERLKQTPAQVVFLKLLARLELTGEQAERAIAREGGDILKNPYLLFENDRIEFDPISFGAVDRGLYPGKKVSSAHALPESCNPRLSEYHNECRLRAATVQLLEESSNEGHTLLPIKQLSEAAAELSVVHEIPLDAETVDICREEFAPTIAVFGNGKDMFLQLDRYQVSGKMLAAAINDRPSASAKVSPVDWLNP
jgi:hypothetical protein